VKIAAPEPAAAVIKAYSPDMIAYPLRGNYLAKSHVPQIMKMQSEANAMVIGGGLCRTAATIQAIRAIIDKTKIPTVIDADAIHAVRGLKLKSDFIVTPHAHEFFMLSGKEVNQNMKHRISATAELARKMECIVLLKGHVDIISDGIVVEENETGNPFMAKGGFGDTLAGVAGALLARKVAPFDAACAAAYINGKAGDLAAKRLGEGIVASDLLWEIPNAIR
jgi:ADP-dependent NAD(P)H-hydrate dehydratase / NAD(P)H-hydrate epimerase